MTPVKMCLKGRYVSNEMKRRASIKTAFNMLEMCFLSI